MFLQFASQDLLEDSAEGNRLFRDWLRGDLKAGFLDPDHQDSRRELQLALENGKGQSGGTSGTAPLFGSDWVSGWLETVAPDHPSDSDRDLFHSQLLSLQEGRAEVVVTGQQPGYLGGPLYTLYKVATVVALARQRTAAGHPSVPVFWSGDDDSDLAEALGPVAWDGSAEDFHRSPGQGQGPGKADRSIRLGRLGADRWSGAAARWLEQMTARQPKSDDALPHDLATIWIEAVAEGLSWSRLARRALWRVFTGCGLVIVSGDDPHLHRAAGPLYEKMLPKTGALADLAAARGRELTAGRWHAQISARSLARPWFVTDGDRRVPWEPATVPGDTGSLRPGVMLRSPLQDWLLRPAAVIVGPGELAYLRQLDPLYAELGLKRPPLIPRLFAWAVPEGWDPGILRDFRRQGTGDPRIAGRLAEEAEGEARRLLGKLLERELGMESARAESLAAGRARRWRKGVEAMIGDELKRSRGEMFPGRWPWVLPDGMRQERRLAYVGALASWGSPLVATVIEAAASHLDGGSRGDWREFTIEVPAPG